VILPFGDAHARAYQEKVDFSLSNVAKLAAHPKFMWVFNANCDGTIIYNDPVPLFCCGHFDKKTEKVQQVFHKIDNNQNFSFVSARY
jgi:hypothetical protein